MTPLLRLLVVKKAFCCVLLLIVLDPSEGFSLSFTRTAGAAVLLRDHSKDAISLFNNMRTPAALLTGGLVPLGIITAPQVADSDSKFVKLLKKANMLLAVMSLLSELIAVMYSSIAINKLVEVPSPPTAGVADLISQKYELAWLGTNFHFLLGMMGFGLLVGNRVYIAFGNPIGNLAIGLSTSFFLKALSVINTGIAMGSGSGASIDPCGGVNCNRFASNFFGLTVKYICGTIKSSTDGICSVAAVAVGFVTIVQTIRALFFQVADENVEQVGLD